jgi:hypothetical protein
MGLNPHESVLKEIANCTVDGEEISHGPSES